MSTPKGYSSQCKEDRLKAEFTTIQPVSAERFGLETLANAFTFEVGNDAIDSYVDGVITAPGHSAVKGDSIRITSGDLSTRIFTVWDTTTDTITLGQSPDPEPAAATTFTILRYTPAKASSSGELSFAGVVSTTTSFIRNGVAQDVEEDTVVPANNRPLPVKITGLDGDVVINSSNLNLEVQLAHNGAVPDSVRLGDGTNTAVFGAGTVAATVLRTTPASDSPHLLATRHEAAATPLSAQISNGAAFADFGAGTVAATVIRTTPASDSPHLLATRHETAATPLAAELSNGTNFADFGAGVVGAAVLRTTPASDSPHLLATRHEAAATPLAAELSNGTNFADFGAGVVGAAVLRTTPASDSPHLLATRHEAALTPLSAQISNGTSFASFGAGAVDAMCIRTTPASDSPHLLATRHEAAATPLAGQISNGTNFASFGSGTVGATVIRTTPASDSQHLLATRHEAAATPLSVRLTDGSAFLSMTTAKADGPWRNDYTSTSVTTAAYTEIDASTSSAIKKLFIFDSSGQTMKLATGAGGAEVDILYIPPGGIDVPYDIPASTRLSIRAVSATASVGEIVINALT